MLEIARAIVLFAMVFSGVVVAILSMPVGIIIGAVIGGCYLPYAIACDELPWRLGLIGEWFDRRT